MNYCAVACGAVPRVAGVKMCVERPIYVRDMDKIKTTTQYKNNNIISDAANAISSGTEQTQAESRFT